MHEQDRAEMVGDDSVVLLRHRAVVAPEPRLQVCDRDLHLHGGERSGQRRVDVAGNHDECGLLLEEDALDADECAGRLLGMRSRTDAEEDVGLRQAELLEEDVGHLRVVVLARMDEEDVDAASLKCAEHRRGFHEVGACAHDEADLARHRGKDRLPAGMHVLAILFWIGAGLLVWTHAAYPLAARLLAAVRTRRVSADDGYVPPVCVIVAAHNEESVIERRLANLRELDYPVDRLELVVSSDASTDRTEELAAAAGARVVENARAGKVAAQHNAVRSTDAEVVAFSDANCTWAPDALRKLVRNFADPDVAYVCGRLNITNEDGRNKEGVYWRYELALRADESRLDSVTGGNGSIYAVRRSDYVEVDARFGHDLSLPYLMVQRGRRAVYEPEANAYEKATPTTEDEYRRKVRMFEHC